MIDTINVRTGYKMDSKAKIPYEQLLNKKGRARLPDKLMDHLDRGGIDDVIWWLPDGNSFAMDSTTVQEQFLDIHFRGTKLASFIRSLNRWYANLALFYWCFKKGCSSFSTCSVYFSGASGAFFFILCLGTLSAFSVPNSKEENALY